MTRFSLPAMALSFVAAFALAGCDFIGTHDGYEEGEVPYFGAAGMDAYEVVAVDPPTASAGDTVTLYTVSANTSPVDGFGVDDFWFCTYDGEDAMLETGGDGYDSEVDVDEFLATVDTDLTEEELTDSLISTVTFTVPEGTVTGESFVITPNGRTEWFSLNID